MFTFCLILLCVRDSNSILAYFPVLNEVSALCWTLKLNLNKQTNILLRCCRHDEKHTHTQKIAKKEELGVILSALTRF